jgi:hypothetical protein
MDTVQINVGGTWVAAPALSVGDNVLAVRGKWIRVASIVGEEWLENDLVDPERCVTELRRATHCRADVFTFTQRPFVACDKYDYPHDWVSVAVADVQDFNSWWGGLPQETRKNVRRAGKRSVSIRISPFDDALIGGIAEVQNETQVRQGKRNRHYGKTLDEVRRDHGGFIDHSEFITASCEGEFVGFLKLVYRGGIASVMQLNSRMSHYEKRPANALLAKAVELCAAKGISHLIYGRFHYGNKRNSSFTEFKARHGFREVLVPRYYVPLTSLGSLYAKFGLYRGFLGTLPPGVIAVGLKGRSAWYQLKNFASRCSSTVEQPIRNRPMERSNPPAGSSSKPETTFRQP